MNKTIKKNTIERIKDVILVVLVLSTILLLYFFWKDITFKDITFGDFVWQTEITSADALDAMDVVIPSNILVCFDKDAVTYIVEGKRRCWDGGNSKDSNVKRGGMLQGIIAFHQADNLLMEEIKAQEYEQIMSTQSIRAKFDYHVSFSGFCDKLEIKKISGYDNIEAMTEIGYSEESPQSLFLYDGFAGRYYRLVSNVPQEMFSTLFSNIPTQGYTAYDSIGAVALGADSENATLIPLEIQTNIKSFDYAKDFYLQDNPGENEKITTMAKRFFGSGFDFVRKIEEVSGSVTYMYGYGEKVLIVGTDSTFEYKEEASGGTSQLKYFDALDKALQFIAEHGGFETLDGQKLTPHLKQGTAIVDRKKGFRFVFGLSIDDYELSYTEGNALIVDVTGGQVTYLKRNYINFDESKVYGTNEDSFSVVNTLAQNYEEIYRILVDEKLMEVQPINEDKFTLVMEQVTGVRYGYIRQLPQEQSEEMVDAVWIIDLYGGAIEVYLDLSSESLLGYTIK